MNSISAKFESYAAPLATALLCAALASHGGGNHHSSRADVAGGGVGGGGGRGGSFSHEHEHELRELHLKLQKMLFKCVKRKDDLSHRLIGLKCLTLQLPTLIVAKGPTKENLAAIDRLFDICREHTMQVECRSDKDVPISLRKYADLLTAHSRLVLALANVNFELVVQEIIMKKLNYFQTKHKFGHDSVVALAALRMLLMEQSDRLTGEDNWSKAILSEATGIVASIVISGAKSGHLKNGLGSVWMLTLQLLMGALHCLRLLWPKQWAAGGGDHSGVNGSSSIGGGGGNHYHQNYASHSHASHHPQPTHPPSSSSHPAHNARNSSAPKPPVELDELLPMLASYLCHHSAPQLRAAAADLLSHVVSTGAAEVLPRALSAMTDSVYDISGASARVRRREALQHVAPLISRWLEAPRVARMLAPCVHKMQALAVLLLAEPCPKLRGEAAQLLLILSPVAAAAAAESAGGRGALAVDRADRADRASASSSGHPHPQHHSHRLQHQGNRSSVALSGNRLLGTSAADATAGGGGAGGGSSVCSGAGPAASGTSSPSSGGAGVAAPAVPAMSVAQALLVALPSVAEHALSDPLGLDLWGGSVGARLP